MIRFLFFIPLFVALLVTPSCRDSAQHPDLQAISSFGANPGDLKMYMFAPSMPTADMPLVVAMHGCTQTAAQLADLTDWNRLGEQYGFYVIYPEQAVKNNVSKCFNWFQEGDINRDQGEARSIRSMVDHMLLNHPIDPQRVFVTGLSAGGAMTSVMLACYPEKFAAGAVHAGGPYKAAIDVWQSMSALAGNVTKGAEEWGNLVRAQNPSFTGNYPRVATFHGTSDNVVSANNAIEIVKQWTNVHGTDATPNEATDAFHGAADVQRAIYRDNDGNQVVVRYTISSMGHAISIDPGGCRHQGGNSGTHATDKKFFSTYWSASFFGIVPQMKVSGPTTVSPGQVGTVYSVPAHSGSTYVWQLPEGCSITSGEGTASITVTWGDAPGTVSCTETDNIGCTYAHEPLNVNF